MAMRKDFVIHLRRFKNGKLQPNGGYTVVAQPSGNVNYLDVVWSKCSKRDAFNKKIGRAVAIGRMTCARTKDVYTEQFTPDEFIQTLRYLNKRCGDTTGGQIAFVEKAFKNAEE